MISKVEEKKINIDEVLQDIIKEATSMQPLNDDHKPGNEYRLQNRANNIRRFSDLLISLTHVEEA
jgi:hypothetical protein